MTYLLLAEKPSAAKNFAKALGGMQGTFNGQAYQIQSLYGHMLEFVEPHEMVSGEAEKKLFHSWEPGSMPWDISQLNWQKQAQRAKNMRTGKVTSKQGAINDVKKAAQGKDAIVIATDRDPSGEGQMIGWEVIQAIGWRGPVKRLYFADETEKEIQKGFKAIVDLPAASKDGEYVKAEVRSRWDFVSMQLTRLATSAARSKGYGVVVRQGRLKSVMTKLVADQLALVKAYKKKPYYEVRYKDDKNNVFSRTFDPDKDGWRFAKKEDAERDAQNYGPGTVQIDSKTRKETAPGALLDLGGLASILGKKGFAPKEVLATYQKMYEAKIVSYPRTEDKFISGEQFNEMLPLINKIAGVVGADVTLLTHTTPRKTHVKNGGAHGANRPGTKVPASLDAVAQYGPSAKAIYETLAKNFLAMFGENYVYDSIKGHIKEHPEFTATVSVPVDLGFKAIFDADKETAVEGDDELAQSTGLGTKANAFTAEGVNKKPPHPSQAWLERQLSRYDVGTGATRVSTLSEVTAGKTALLTNTRGKLNLTKIGEIAAALLDGSQIASPSVTEKLFKAMRDVGTFKVRPSDVLNTVTTLVKHDKDVFYKNAETLKQKVGAPDASMKVGAIKPKAEGVYKPTGQKIRFSKEWGGHAFTDQEIEKLLAGEYVGVHGTSASGKPYYVEGHLGEGEYKGRKFWGFQKKKASEYTAATAPMPASWSGYTFTDADKKALRAGQKVKITATSARTKKPFDTEVTFELVPKSEKYDEKWGIVPHFEERKPASSYTRANAPFKTEFSGHKLTDAEIKEVRAGHQIMVTAKSKKSGKKFTCNLSLELKKWNGTEFWGLEAHFN